MKQPERLQKMMIRILGLAVFLILASCAGWPQESPQLPEKFLGLWEPYSDDMFQNAVVDKSGVILFPSTYERFNINDIWTYKTIMVEGNNAYLLVKDETDPRIEALFHRKAIPFYKYVRLEYFPPEYGITMLCIAVYSYYLPEKPYRLTKTDWSLPISEHKKRIKLIPDYTEARSIRECYAR